MTDSDRSHPSACPFCRIDASAIVAENGPAFAVRDLYPVTPLHTLILPRRHVASWFDLAPEEAMAINELSKRLRDDILATDGGVEGFNIGINIGAVAGHPQTQQAGSAGAEIMVSVGHPIRPEGRAKVVGV